MSANHSNAPYSVTLEDTIASFAKWRSNKSRHGGSQTIPTELWDMVFALEANGLHPRTIKSALSISSTQYRNQQAKRQQNKVKEQGNNKTSKEEAIFSEVVVAPNKSTHEEELPSLANAVKENRHQINQLKTMDNRKHELNSDTVIVECIHSDGHRLKIHVTSKKISEIFSAFLQQSASANLSC
jgi:hypothetical protein